MRVEVYFNLHKYTWSVRSAKTGRVLLHTDKVHINNPTFVVRKAGRERVLREGKKNVHAFVRGDITVFDDFEPDYHPNYLDYTLVSYNPYKFDTFFDVYDTTPVRTAKRAFLQLQPSMVVGDWRNRPYLYAEGARS
jgi:hypothetical protein